MTNLHNSRFLAHGIIVGTLLALSFSNLFAQSKSRITSPIDNANTVRVVGSAHPLARTANDLGRVDANLPMERMILVMQPGEEQKAAALKIIDSLHDPQSAGYRQWLTPEEFGNRFGVTDRDLGTISSWLQGQGFRVTAVARGKQFIEFSGTARQVENAFRTEIHRYLVNAEEHVANASDISLPRALAPAVAGVLSLHDFRKRPAHRELGYVHRDAATGKLVPDFTLSTKSGPVHFMAPGDFARIYNTEPLLQQKINGSGVSIAIVARSNVELSDVQTFRKIFGLPARDPLFIINGMDPGVVGGGEDVEASLDVEWSGAAAPNATIKMVISSSTITTDGVDLSLAYIIDNVVAPIMSASFSSCEAGLGPAGNAFFNGLYEQAAAEGITAFVSTGDDGPDACSPQVALAPANLAAVSGLASTPFNTAVGGTQFAENGLDGTFWNANNRPDLSSAVGYIPETVWNESCDPTKDKGKCGGSNLFFIVAGSGGPSNCVQSQIIGGKLVCQAGYPKPSWQAGIGVPGDNVRDLPDLSLDSGGAHDGVLLCVEGSCQTTTSNGQTILENAAVVGGTSVASPSMAGVMALIEQKNGKFQGLANFNFYKLAAKDKLANCNSTLLTNPTQASTCFFHDVTQGSNTVPDVPGYPARTGFDMSTGLGSVNAANVVAGWNVAPKLASVTSILNPSITGQHGQPVPIEVKVKPQTGNGAPSGEFDLITSFGSVLGGTLQNGGFSGTVADLPGGLYVAKARYSGDAMFRASSSGDIAVHIAPENSVVSVTAWDLNLIGGLFPVSGPLFYGQPTALDIHVDGVSGQGKATGKFTVRDGTRDLGTFPLSKGGRAFLQIDNLPAATGMLVGQHHFTVAYSGDNSFKPATSGTIKISVVKKTPVTLITPVPGDVTLGAPEKLVLLVGGAGLALPAGTEPPSGTVQLLDNGKAISPKLPIVFDGPEGPEASQAVFTTTFLAVGTHSLTLDYSGDANYTAVNGSPFARAATVNVNAPAGAVPQLTVQQMPSSITLGQNAQYSVTVKPRVSGAATPTGTVSLVSGNGGVLAGPQALSGGSTTLLLTFAGAGEFEIAASYSGDKNYSPFTSAILNTNVGRGKPTVNLNTPMSAVAAGTQISLTATVAGAPNNPVLANVVPFGAVQFFDAVNGGAPQPLGAPHFLTIGNGGTPTFTLPIVLQAGLHAITVQYLGDSNWLPTTSNAVTVTVK